MYNQIFNYHTHTARCGHAIGSDEEYILEGIKAGYKILGFSEHIQHRAMKGKLNRINYEAFDEYFESFHRYKEIYKSQIVLYCGLEAEFIPEWLCDLYDIREKCDYIILGQHVGGATKWHYNKICSDTDVLHYATDIEYAIRTGLFSVIAHPDYFMISRSSWTINCEKAAEKICLISKEYRVPLEINLKGLYTDKKIINGQLVHPYPYWNFWKIASDIGSPVIFGVDAHEPASLGNITQYSEAYSLLRDLPLNIQADFIPSKPLSNKS